jgi:chorismate dehydratase
MPDTLQIGSVSFLNARPLVQGLERSSGSRGIELTYAAPSVLADRMLEGGLDLALLPVIELARMPELEIVPGLGIVTSGASRSVLLVSKVPIERVATVALDSESRTSNALAQVLFAAVWRCRPEFTVRAGTLGHALDDHDAAVRIGDKALFEAAPPGAFIYDLGTVWSDETQLPFVFAAWAARAGVLDRELYQRLHDARRRGLADLEQIARDYVWCGRSYSEVARNYLTDNIRFRLGSSELQAMQLFFRLAAEIGVIASPPELRMAMTRWSVCHETAARVRTR